MQSDFSEFLNLTSIFMLVCAHVPVPLGAEMTTFWAPLPLLASLRQGLSCFSWCSACSRCSCPGEFAHDSPVFASGYSSVGISNALQCMGLLAQFLTQVFLLSEPSPQA